jgi:lipopolysaccharide/colanic/teichoic acid biosynthesis glycosyltransferase
MAGRSAGGCGMKVRTPTSNESMRRFLRAIDVVSVFAASPVAMGLRDPSLFSEPRIGSAVTYCLIGSGAGLLMVIAFHLGKSVHDHLSAREVRSVVAASLAATALTAVAAFSLDRLNYVPRSLPLIQLLVLCSLMLGGRALATKRRRFGAHAKNYLVQSHTLLVGASDFALSYLKMLDAFDVDRTNIVAILDWNPKLFGRAILGHPIIGPPSAFARVVAEYKVHGVEITRVLICENQPKESDHAWVKIEDYCKREGVKLSFLSDILGFELDETIQIASNREDQEVQSKGYRFGKRAFDLSLSIVAAIAVSPFAILITVGTIIDLGWPIIFWQKRIGYCGRPFLIYKFRTLHAPYDRQGNFVAEGRRASRFGSLLRRLRLDELPQLWNVFTGEMSLVGPRPLLPIDQPNNGQLRLKVPPGVTGWAQINGGRQITADNKGSLDDWYVRHATFWLDVRIIMRTVGIVVLGDDRHLPPSSGLVEVAKPMAEIGDPSALRWARATNAREGAAV